MSEELTETETETERDVEDEVIDARLEMIEARVARASRLVDRIAELVLSRTDGAACVAALALVAPLLPG